MNDQAILRAINELDSWEQRRENLQAHLDSMSREERKLCSLEMVRVKEQIYHYKKLIKQMKTEVAPPSSNAFFEQLR